MAILQLPLPIAANTGVTPNMKMMKVTDNLATVTTANYLNYGNLQGYTISPEDLLEVYYDWDDQAQTGTYGVFTVAVSAAGIITLTEYQRASGVNATLHTVANEIAVFSNTTGDIKSGATTAANLDGDIQAGASATAGKFISYPATALKGSLQLAAVNNTGNTATVISNAAMGQASTVSIPDPGASTANFILSASSISTQTISTGLSITGNNNVQTSGGGQFLAGSSGAAGHFASYPATAANGHLDLIAIDNAGGDFDTIISNAASVGQDQTITIPDAAAATANFVLAPSALVSGNLVKASGTAGLIVDAGGALISGITADIGGAGAGPISVAVAGLTASSPIVASIASSSNAVAVAKCIGTATGFDITFTADPGAACVVNYIATSVAV